MSRLDELAKKLAADLDELPSDEPESPAAPSPGSCRKRLLTALTVVSQDALASAEVYAELIDLGAEMALSGSGVWTVAAAYLVEAYFDAAIDLVVRSEKSRRDAR